MEELAAVKSTSENKAYATMLKQLQDREKREPTHNNGSTDTYGLREAESRVLKDQLHLVHGSRVPTSLRNEIEEG